MTISRQTLFGKLSVTLYRSIESTTSFCKLRGNPYVELVHWLHQILQQPDDDLHRIVRHAAIDHDALNRDFARALVTLPADASSISDFSWHIESVIERAWALASLSHGERRVHGAWLLTALASNAALRRVLLLISPAFAKISVDQSEDVIPAWIDGSPEAQESAYDYSQFDSGAAPGEASGAMPAAARAAPWNSSVPT